MVDTEWREEAPRWGGALEGADATHCAHYHQTEESTMKRNLHWMTIAVACGLR